MSDNNQGFPVPEEPLTREERYLSVIAQVTPATDVPPYPLTREEAYLDKIVENGTGGGGGGFTPTQAQLDAMNSGITAERLETDETNILLKANTADVNAATTSLQNQINQIEISATAEAVVAPEVAAARVDVNGNEYATLKERSDATQKDVEYITKNSMIFKTNDLTIEGTYLRLDGTTASHPSFSASDYIDCKFSRIIFEQPKANAGLIIACYTEKSTESFIGGTDVEQSMETDLIYNIPENTKYIRFSYRTKKSDGGGDFNAFTTIFDLKFEEPENEKPFDFFEFFNSSINAILVGDSITAGQGSPTYIQFTREVEGVTHTYRGNAPDNPDPPTGYEVGDFIVTTGTVHYYESLSALGWGQLLKDYIEDKTNSTVHNRGCAGMTTANVITYFNDIVTNDADVVFIMLGTNDRVNDIALAQTRANITNLVSSCQNGGKKVVLLSPPPALVSHEESPRALYHLEDLDNMLTELSSELNVPFFSFFKFVTKYLCYNEHELSYILNDAVHPNDMGYKLMYKNMLMNFGLAPKIDGATW